MGFKQEKEGGNLYRDDCGVIRRWAIPAEPFSSESVTRCAARILPMEDFLALWSDQMALSRRRNAVYASGTINWDREVSNQI